MTTALFTPLTDLQERFVVEYLVDYNASAAARRAGYSPKTHGAQSAALMKNLAVRARIDVGIKAMRERIGVCAMNAWQELARAAFFDIRGFIDKDGKMVPFHEMDEDTIAALNVTCRTLKGGETVMSVRQPSRLTALLALERRFAKEEEIERQVLKDEAERQAAEDEKIARERRYKPEHTQVKEAEARQAQQRELDALRAERDALAGQVKAVKLPEMPVQPPRRPFAAAPAAAAQAVARKAEPTQVAPANVAPARVAPAKVAPAKAAPAGLAASAKEQARRALDALFEPAAPASAPEPAQPAGTLPVLELLADAQPAPGLATQAGSVPNAAPARIAVPVEATVPIQAEVQVLAGAPADVAVPAQVAVSAAVVDHGAAAPATPPAGQSDEDDEGDEWGEEDPFFVPAPAPTPAPPPIQRRKISLWGTVIG